MNYVIASSRSWHKDLPSRLNQLLQCNFEYIEDPNELTVERLVPMNPRYIFFPHWSSIIPPEIYNRFECIIFHMTDVPFGRGGSPLQNLIMRGIYETKMTALRCSNMLDAGPVYMKKSLSLYGSAEEIFIRASKLIERMIAEIILSTPEPTEQSGEVVLFARRKPNESNISSLSELCGVYDYIRMLDASGYPHAFLETASLKFEFTEASIRPDHITARVKITKKE